MRAKSIAVVCALALTLAGCGVGPTAPVVSLPSAERGAGPSGIAPIVTGGPRVHAVRATLQDGSLVFSGTSDQAPDSLNHSWILRASIRDPDDPSGKMLACDSRFTDAAGDVIVYLLDPDVPTTPIGSASLVWHGRRFQLAMPLFGRTSGTWHVYAFALPADDASTIFTGTFGDTRVPRGATRSSR